MSRHGKGEGKSRKTSKRILSSVGKELKKRPPKILKLTARKKGKKAAERQRRAILLSKARKRGARIKKSKSRK